MVYGREVTADSYDFNETSAPTGSKRDAHIRNIIKFTYMCEYLQYLSKHFNTNRGLVDLIRNLNTVSFRSCKLTSSSSCVSLGDNESSCQSNNTLRSTVMWLERMFSKFRCNTLSFEPRVLYDSSTESDPVLRSAICSRLRTVRRRVTGNNLKENVDAISEFVKYLAEAVATKRGGERQSVLLLRYMDELNNQQASAGSIRRHINSFVETTVCDEEDKFSLFDHSAVFFDLNTELKKINDTNASTRIRRDIEDYQQSIHNILEDPHGCREYRYVYEKIVPLIEKTTRSNTTNLASMVVGGNGEKNAVVSMEAATTSGSFNQMSLITGLLSNGGMDESMNSSAKVLDDIVKLKLNRDLIFYIIYFKYLDAAVKSTNDTVLQNVIDEYLDRNQPITRQTLYNSYVKLQESKLIKDMPHMMRMLLDCAIKSLNNNDGGNSKKSVKFDSVMF